MLLALDPSVGDCGYAVMNGTHDKPEIVVSGTWHPSKAAGKPDRFEQLADFVVETAIRHAACDAAVEIPDGGERFFLGRGGQRQRMSGKSERTYAQAVGVCRAAARAAGATVWPVRVTTWKGRSSKNVALLVASQKLGRDVTDTNEADAIGIGLWWLWWTTAVRHPREESGGPTEMPHAAAYRRLVEDQLRR